MSDLLSGLDEAWRWLNQAGINEGGTYDIELFFEAPSSESAAPLAVDLEQFGCTKGLIREVRAGILRKHTEYILSATLSEFTLTKGNLRDLVVTMRERASSYGCVFDGWEVQPED